jgi:hypothetical protein
VSPQQDGELIPDRRVVAADRLPIGQPDVDVGGVAFAGFLPVTRRAEQELR